MKKAFTDISSLCSPLSRREFLKLSGTGLFGLLLSPLGFSLAITEISEDQRFQGVKPIYQADLRNLYPDQQGRVVETKATLYNTPSLSGKKIKDIWQDSVIPITNVTVGDDSIPFNRIWYHIGDEGYIHSGVIQPVRTLINPPIANIPAEGSLAEVTVPFTDARWGPDKDQLFAYRYYYGTTHWVIGLEHEGHLGYWYRVMDDKWEFEFYVPATHLRLIPPDELKPLSPDVPAEFKRLEVRTNEQLVVGYEWDKPVYMARAATGAKFSNGNFETPPGHHITFFKRPSRHMAAGNLAYNGYDLPGVPWISYFTESGMSFHGTYWHNNFGHPRSHGCVNLSPLAAKWLYLWTLPVVPPDQQEVYETYGTAVDVI
jgi:hypothetical protein